MNNDNTVKIGVSLKWRDTFDLETKYYQENLVTSCGCVFRCKALSTIGKSPIYTEDEFGYLEFINTDVWSVVVDMAYYYNFVIDQKRYTDQILKYVEYLKEMIDIQQGQIAAIEKDNLDQWDAIHTLESITDDLQRQIDEINDFTASLQNQINDLVVVTDDLQVQIDDVKAWHEKEVAEINERIDALIQHVDEMQDKIEADLAKVNADLNNRIDALEEKHDNDVRDINATIDANKEAADTQIANLEKKHDADVKTINSTIAANKEAAENLVNALKEQHDNDVAALNQTISANKTAAENLVNALKEQHEDDVKTINQTIAANKEDAENLIAEMVADLEKKHNEDINALTSTVTANKEAADAQFQAIADEQTIQDERLEDAEQEIININYVNNSQQTLIEEHQKILDVFSNTFSLIDLGIWENDLTWNNDAYWSNLSITQQISGGVTVIAYDPITQTLTI